MVSISSIGIPGFPFEENAGLQLNAAGNWHSTVDRLTDFLPRCNDLPKTILDPIYKLQLQRDYSILDIGTDSGRFPGSNPANCPA